MYSLTRFWIGLNEARMLIQVSGRGQDDEHDRQPVHAELVLDAEHGDPVDLLDELEAGMAVAREAEQKPQRGHPGDASVNARPSGQWS